MLKDILREYGVDVGDITKLNVCKPRSSSPGEWLSFEAGSEEQWLLFVDVKKLQVAWDVASEYASVETIDADIARRKETVVIGDSD